MERATANGKNPLSGGTHDLATKASPPREAWTKLKANGRVRSLYDKNFRPGRSRLAGCRGTSPSRSRGRFRGIRGGTLKVLVLKEGEGLFSPSEDSHLRSI